MQALMATRQQLAKIGAQIDQLAAAINPDESLVNVVVFEGETADFALSWHARQRPEHAGRRVQLQYRREARALAALFLRFWRPAALTLIALCAALQFAFVCLETYWKAQDRAGAFARDPWDPWPNLRSKGRDR
jgi:hypothetical protein